VTGDPTGSCRPSNPSSNRPASGQHHRDPTRQLHPETRGERTALDLIRRRAGPVLPV
jgi:hypothetical protein